MLPNIVRYIWQINVYTWTDWFLVNNLESQFLFASLFMIYHHQRHFFTQLTTEDASIWSFGAEKIQNNVNKLTSYLKGLSVSLDSFLKKNIEKEVVSVSTEELLIPCPCHFLSNIPITNTTVSITRYVD